MANTVTIDERDGEVILHVKYGESICGDCHTRQLVDSLNKELDAWRKKASSLEDERDELKAKYEDASKQVDALEGEVNELKAKLATPRIDCFKCTHKDRLAAAERCIDDLLVFVRDIRGPLYDHDMHTWEDKADSLVAKYWKEDK